MEQVRALDATSGRSIPAILLPTFKIYTPLLVKNKDTILSLPRSEHPYGPHPRQKLDIYTPPSSFSNDGPILVFFYGGGLIHGDKISPTVPEGLLYANLGSFFAARGITTILPDYRRVNSQFGGEDAVYPSGGEDVSLALKWIEEKYLGDGPKREVVICGNSAGGVHISTFLFEGQFLEQRKRYMAGEGKIHLNGAIELAVPLHFGKATDERTPMLTNYYGSPEGAEGKCAFGLLQKLVGEGKSREEAAVPKCLCLVGEMDPEDEITEPMREFVKLWESSWGAETVEFEVLQGHNHISPPWALNAGEKEGEKWGEDVVKWIMK
ncbi:Alpha/Beta hydrolase protein [Tricladium varicosporioides]|nr:Alpha/Beta hydrolase protein [Hymenoscyphus varicosporioides]